jgi:DNA-binding MarR family transcriptional regulator
LYYSYVDNSETNIQESVGQPAGSATELRAAAVETWVLARRLVKSAKRDLAHRLEAHGVAVGALAYRVMRLLAGGTSTLAELSRTLGIGATALVPVIDGLEEKGFVNRGRDPKDRRRTPLSLTPAGTDVLALVPAVDEEDSLVQGLAALGPAKSRQLLELLGELVKEVSGDETAVSELAARLAAAGDISPTAAAKRRGV